MTGRVQGKIALVTGAASGIGRATAELLASEGASVIVSDLNDGTGHEVAGEIAESGGIADYVTLDVGDEQSWIDAIGLIDRRHGALDIIVNNAGISQHEDILVTELSKWHRDIAINLDSVFLSVKHGVPLIRRGNRGGSIINISSTAGFLPVAWLPGYSATKAAVLNLTKCIAQQCGEAHDGIRCNAVLPGIIDTPMHPADRRGAAMEERSRELVPLGIKGDPVDVAHGVLWLASDDSRYVSGAEITIDGGLTTRFPLSPHTKKAG